jgi:LPS-assembly lipoprotein
LLLSACGFRPLYGQFGANPGAQAIFASIYVEPIEAEGVGYELRSSLMDLLESSGNAGGARYRLQVDLKESHVGSNIQNEVVGGLQETTTTRYNYTLTAKYQLTDAKGTVVTKGEESTLTSYNVVNSAYATLAARQDARKRAADDVADHLRMALGVYFAQKAGR